MVFLGRKTQRLRDTGYATCEMKFHQSLLTLKSKKVSKLCDSMRCIFYRYNLYIIAMISVFCDVIGNDGVWNSPSHPQIDPDGPMKTASSRLLEYNWLSYSRWCPSLLAKLVNISTITFGLIRGDIVFMGSINQQT